MMERIGEAQRGLDSFRKTLSQAEQKGEFLNRLQKDRERLAQDERILSAIADRRPYAVIVGDVRYNYAWASDDPNNSERIVTRASREPINRVDWEFGTMLIAGEAVPIRRVAAMFNRDTESETVTEPTDFAVKQQAAMMLGLDYEPIFQGQNPLWI